MINCDLKIRVTDEWHNYYVVDEDNWEYILVFKYEDWTGIIGDGKSHINIIAEYVNKDGAFLVKFQDEELDELIKQINIWNNNHRNKV